MYLLRSDPDDFRDYRYESTNSILQSRVDLREYASRVEDQLDLGSCTGAAVIGAYELLVKKDHPSEFVDLSSLFVYYNARVIEGYVGEDVGAYIRSAIKATYKYGVCAEQLWPYKIADFAAVPPVACYVDAAGRKIKNYRRLAAVNDILDALTTGRPVVIGVTLYGQFDELSSTNTILTSPAVGQEPIGGHAVCLVGYDLDRKLMLVRNSFGTDWGQDGYFWMTFDYVEQQADDIWVFDIDLIK